jgi:hypothetical protein
MSDLKRKVATAITTGAVLLFNISPVAAGVTIEISGNGQNSTNAAGVVLSQTTTVVQSNNADIDNNVSAYADTGNNSAEGNTGGNVGIETGDAEVNVDVANTVNSNSAEVDCCGLGDVDVLISENGEDSDNTVELGLESTTEVYQENEADVDNDVDAYAGTGENDADGNTGGDVEIKTGKASVGVALSTTANSNSAMVGSGDGGGSLSAWIVGNGKDSDNDIKIGLLHTTLLAQANEADVDNDVDASADTGNNSADDNTGGEVMIDTGDAEVDVTIDNLLNFNWAAVDCGCLLDDLWAKIAGNGQYSDNDIELGLEDTLEVFQGNCAEGEGAESYSGRHGDDCELDNDVDAYAGTGENDADDNTEGDEKDPSIETGNAGVEVDIENGGNSNVFGDAPEWDLELPSWFGFNLNLSLDLSDLLEAILGA